MRLQGLDAIRRRVVPTWSALLGDTNICGALHGQTFCGLALKDKRVKRRAIVRVYILDPAIVVIDS